MTRGQLWFFYCKTNQNISQDKNMAKTVKQLCAIILGLQETDLVFGDPVPQPDSTYIGTPVKEVLRSYKIHSSVPDRDLLEGWVYTREELSYIHPADEVGPTDCGTCYVCCRAKHDCINPVTEKGAYGNWWASLASMEHTTTDMMKLALEATESKCSPVEDEDDVIPEECLGCETGCDADGPHRLSNGEYHPECGTRAAEEERRAKEYVGPREMYGRLPRLRDVDTSDEEKCNRQTLEEMAQENNFSDEESSGQTSGNDSEWVDDEDEDSEDEDSDWDGDVVDNTDSEDEVGDETASLDGIDESAVVEGRRTRSTVQRFSNETQHLHPGFGGSAGANNGHTQGRKVDMGEETEQTWADYQRVRQRFGDNSADWTPDDILEAFGKCPHG